MTRFQVLISICFTAVIGGLLALWLISVNPRPQKHMQAISGSSSSNGPNDGNKATDNDNAKPFSLKDIPIYPDARNKFDPYSTLPKTNETTRYQSDASPDAIADFYKNALAQPGWELKAVDKLVPDEPLLYFQWSDPQGEAPYDLRVGVSIRGDEPRYVELGLTRLPDANKIPLYPGAAQPTVVYLPGQPDDPRVVTKVTSYTTDASPSEIKQFYESFLESYGWKVWQGQDDTANTATNEASSKAGKDHANDNQMTYSFVYAAGGGSGTITRAQVTITTTREASGQTRVELRAEGYNIRDGIKKTQK